MVEERELLPDQDAVLPVDAGGLGERSTQLCGEGARPHRVARGDEHEEHLQREVARRAAKRRRRLVEEDVALALELHAPSHLLLHLGEPGEHALDVLRADRVALGDHGLEQPLRGGELALEVVDEAGHDSPARSRSWS